MIFDALVVIVHVPPSVQGWPLTVVEEFARSLFVTRPVAVNDDVAVKPEMEGEVASTTLPEPVTDASAAVGIVALEKFAPLIEGAFEHPTTPPLFVVATPAVEQPESVNPDSVCVAVHVFAWAKAIEATTDPVVGEIVNVPSELATELTAPEPLPQDPPVVLNAPVELIWRQ